MTDAELRVLLLDCLNVWGAPGQVRAANGRIEIVADSRKITVARADRGLRPARWTVAWRMDTGHGNMRRDANSVAAMLSVVRVRMAADSRL